VIPAASGRERLFFVSDVDNTDCSDEFIIIISLSSAPPVLFVNSTVDAIKMTVFAY